MEHLREADLGLRTEPTVDVGIPTLGNSPYIEETIESILSQTFTAWKLVISENGPGNPLLRRRLEPYLKDPRVRHLVTGEKLGRGTNHNKIIRAGSAPYVGIIHDDDRWHPEFLERRVAFLEEHHTCGFVFSGQVLIDADGRQLGRCRMLLSPGVHTSASVLPLLYRTNFIGCPTLLVRRSAYEAIGVGHPNILFYDHPIWLRLAAQFDVGCLATWDNEYRLHQLQASSNRKNLAAARFPVIEAVSDLPISTSLKRLVRAETHIRCLLDAVERGERRLALKELSSAVSIDPTILVRPTALLRILTALAATCGGEWGRRKLADWRERRWRSYGAEGLLPPAT